MRKFNYQTSRTRKFIKEVLSESKFQEFDTFYMSLSVDDWNLIRHYTDYDHYVGINRNLRQKGTDPIGDKINLIINSSPYLPEDLLLFRAVKYTPPTGELMLKGLVSTTINPLMSDTPIEPGYSVLVIKTGKKTHGILYNEMQEQEVLLAHNIKAYIEESNTFLVEHYKDHEFPSYSVYLLD